MAGRYGKKTKRISEEQTETDPEPGNRFSEEDFVEQVKRLIEPLCSAEGMDLVHVEYRKEPVGRVLRMYIDKPGGISLNDCSRINRQVGDLIDVGLGERNVPEDHSYHLEISSPGTERPLSKLSDFNRFSGNLAKIRIKGTPKADSIQYKSPKNKIIRGILEGVIDQTVKIRVGEEVRNIPFREIVRANLVNYNGDSTC